MLHKTREKQSRRKPQDKRGKTTKLQDIEAHWLLRQTPTRCIGQIRRRFSPEGATLKLEPQQAGEWAGKDPAIQVREETAEG